MVPGTLAFVAAGVTRSCRIEPFLRATVCGLPTTGYWLPRKRATLGAVRIALDIRPISDFGVGTYIRNVIRTLTRLDREIPSTPFPWDVVLLRERARAEEGLGHGARAAALYARVADLWASGDPALQPEVAAARAAAARLRAAGR